MHGQTGKHGPLQFAPNRYKPLQFAPHRYNSPQTITIPFHPLQFAPNRFKSGAAGKNKKRFRATKTPISLPYRYHIVTTKSVTKVLPSKNVYVYKQKMQTSKMLLSLPYRYHIVTIVTTFCMFCSIWIFSF